MSTLDIVLAQKQILIGLLLAVVPFAVAIALKVFAMVQRSNAARLVRQQQAAIVRQAARRALADVEPYHEPVQPVAAGAPVETVAAATSAAMPAPAASHAEPLASGDAPEPEAAVDAEAADDEAPGGDETISSTMQALLSDVFGEDDAAAQYENLLRGFEDVSTHDLITLGQKLMENMQQHQAPPASK